MRRATWSSRVKLHGERIIQVGFRVANVLWFDVSKQVLEGCRWPSRTGLPLTAARAAHARRPRLDSLSRLCETFVALTVRSVSQ